MNPQLIVKTLKTECWDCGVAHHAHRTRDAAVRCIAKAAVRTLRVLQHLNQQPTPKVSTNTGIPASVTQETAQ